MAIFPSTSIASAAGGFDIDNSCRFDGSSVLTWTPSGTADTTTTCTISFWIKHTDVDLSSSTWVYGVDAQDEIFIRSSTKNISYQYQLNNAGWGSQIPVSMQRDPSAWYHIVINFDTAQAVAADRTKYYINGALQTCTGTLPNQNDTFSFGKGGVVHRIGSRNSTAYMSGYLAEFHQVIGTALTADSFGEEGDYGEWKPKSYSGSHGTNGFYLDFSNSSALGNDAAGSNNFTPTNIAASDQMVDSPTNNFCTLNSLDSNGTYVFSEGNLKLTRGSGGGFIGSTFGVSSGKWYWEQTVTNISNYPREGIFCREEDDGRRYSAHPVSGSGNSRSWGANGSRNGPLGDSQSAPTYTSGDILHFAMDLENQKLWIGKNGTWYSTGTTTVTAADIASNSATGSFENITAGKTWEPLTFCNDNSDVWYLNYGADGTFAGTKTAQGNADGNGYGNFYHSPPSGFLALCTKNISDPTVVPSEHFNTVLWTGNATQRNITGVGFQPDLVWGKNRNYGNYHELTDSVRGVTKSLFANDNLAEETDAQKLQAFLTDGFQIGTAAGYNRNGDPHVAWNWKANGSGASNTDGTINTTATSANVAAGFSIVSYTGDDASSATIGHGLSKAPELIILKPRNKVDDWIVGSIQPVASMDFTDYMVLQTTAAVADEATFWNDTAPTSSVFTVGTSNTVNGSSYNYIAYCWHSVEGYSKIGSYTGNGSSDGTFVYCGFRPMYVLFKKIDGAESWRIIDSKRDIDNQSTHHLFANVPNAESDETGLDILSNGFKLRHTDAHQNASGANYLYMAFAETPFKHATAR